MTQKLTPFTDPDVVLARIKPVTDLVHIGLHRFLPETRMYFDRKRRPVDKALHAMLTRYELKHFLLSRQLDVSDEQEPPDFALRALANCGLVITTANCILRVLKWRNCELPQPTTGDRVDFYQHNLFAFEGNDPHPDRPLPPLNLVIGWNADEEHELASVSVVCPWGIDGKVQNKWWKPILLPSTSIVQEPALMIPEPELDEITAKTQLDGDRFPANTSEEGPSDEKSNAS